MKTLLKPTLLLLALLAAGVAIAQNRTAARTFRMPLAAYDCTTLDAGLQGMPLDNANGWRVTASAPGVDSRITGGSLTCCFNGPVNHSGAAGATPTKRWRACNSQLNFTPGTGVRDSSSLDYRSYVGTGSIFYVPSSITLQLADAGVADAGIHLDVTYEMRAK